MTHREDVRRLADEAMQRMGKIDILVNNAGANLPQAIDQIRDEDWDRLVELNLTSCMALTRALAPGMKERRWGRVIHISSIMGLASTAGRNVYSATKAALLGLAKPAPWIWGRPTSRSTALHRDRSPRRCRCRSSAPSSRRPWPGGRP